MSETQHVIFIMGSGHSGSTLTGSLLGAHSQAAFVGEIHTFAKRFIAQDWSIISPHAPCACGEALEDCGFWREVLNACQRRTRMVEHTALMSSLFEVSGVTVLIDSSRRPSRLKFYKRWVRRRSKRKLHVLYLFRDPRAQAYSYLKSHYHQLSPKTQPLGWWGRYLWVLVSKWMLHNTLNLFYHLVSQRVYRLKYEEIVRAPEKRLAIPLRAAGLHFEPEQLHYYEQTQHLLDGNRRVRLTPEPVHKVYNYEDRIPAPVWWLATLLCLPFILWLGYPLRRKARKRAERV